MGSTLHPTPCAVLLVETDLRKKAHVASFRFLFQKEREIIVVGKQNPQNRKQKRKHLCQGLWVLSPVCVDLLHRALRWRTGMDSAPPRTSPSLSFLSCRMRVMFYIRVWEASD